MKKRCRIVVQGCDDNTTIEMDLEDEELELLSKVAAEITKTSMCACQPRMTVCEVQDGNKSIH